METAFAELARRIACDCRFESTAASLCRCLLDFYATHPDAMRLLGDQGQMRVMVACRYLDPAITLSAVQKLVPVAVASPNRVAACMNVLRARKALVPDGTGDRTHDRRAKRFRLSPGGGALIDDFIERMVMAGAPFAAAPADRGHCRDWSEDFLLATLEGGSAMKSGAEAERGQTLRGGALLNLELMRRGFDPGDCSRFSRKAFAARFGLSRAQVVTLVGELERSGWAGTADGGLHPTPLALDAGRVWLGRFLAISTAVLDGRFREIMACSRRQVQAARAAAAAAPAP